MKSEEFPQRARRDRRERLKFKDLAGVETVRGGSSFIYERRQRSERLVDTGPLLRSLKFIIVGGSAGSRRESESKPACP